MQNMRLMLQEGRISRSSPLVATKTKMLFFSIAAAVSMQQYLDVVRSPWFELIKQIHLNSFTHLYCHGVCKHRNKHCHITPQSPGNTASPDSNGNKVTSGCTGSERLNESVSKKQPPLKFDGTHQNAWSHLSTSGISGVLDSYTGGWMIWHSVRGKTGFEFQSHIAELSCWLEDQ